MIVALSFCEKSPVSPRFAQKEKTGTYPTLPHKANTGDLSRFVGAKTPPDRKCRAVQLSSHFFRKRFWAFTRKGGLFKIFDIDLVRG